MNTSRSVPAERRGVAHAKEARRAAQKASSAIATDPTTHQVKGNIALESAAQINGHRNGSLA